MFCGLVVRVRARLEPHLTSSAIGTNSHHYHHPHFKNGEMKLRKVMQPAQGHIRTKQLNQNLDSSLCLASEHTHLAPGNMATLNLLWVTIRKKLLTLSTCQGGPLLSPSLVPGITDRVLSRQRAEQASSASVLRKLVHISEWALAK